MKRAILRFAMWLNRLNEPEPFQEGKIRVGKTDLERARFWKGVADWCETDMAKTFFIEQDKAKARLIGEILDLPTDLNYGKNMLNF